MKNTQKTLTAIVIILAVMTGAIPIISGVTPVIAASGTNPNNITILVDGEPIDFDVPPFIENGYTFVPFRAIYEAFGLYVNYSEQTRVIYATLQTERNSLQYWVNLSEKTIVCEGVEYDPDTLVESTIAAGKSEAKKTGSVMFQKPIELRSVGGRTFVHARLIAESLGCRVGWDGSTRTVVISSEGAVIIGDRYISSLPARVALDHSGIAEAKSARYKATEDELVKLVNEARANRGLSSLEHDDKLTKVARMQAQYMADNEYESCTDNEVQKLVNANFGQITWINVAKNIGGKTTDEIMKTLTNIYSTKNTKIGIGGAKNKSGEMYWICVSVQPFGDSEKTALEDEVLRLINEERTKNGLTLVVKNDDLVKVARIKAQDMSDNNYCTHLSPIYGNPEDMVAKYTPFITFKGEDLAAGQNTSYDVVVAWLNSPAHKRIMLSEDINCVGIGVSMDERGELKWVMITGIQS